MRARAVLYGLLLVVATAAAVLSFAALRDLALLCGFSPELAWLLPVVVDAGAAAGSLVWLGGTVSTSARRFARALALALLGLSVAANALGHGLAAFRQGPAWWVVVIVSAVAPAVLGAVVHLAVLVGRPVPDGRPAEPDVDDDRAAELIAEGAGRRRIARELGVSEYEARRLIDRARTTTPPPELAHAANNGAPIRSEIQP
ncbi:DUF2637 domain-containing protein [Pseudonocardia sp.]|uniref:DUF2637 domain-containing protein n=1 Tax=Pseudonocardia sp. TaxID=60912 RepID=UPI00261B8A4F|nr:DUF2637 domain-containing protein [Pseudonocardia sp.]